MVKLVIVESPAKAKKLKDWLPKGYRVEASVGHIRDLPSGDSKVPERYKGRTVKHGIIIEGAGFEPIYVPTQRGGKVIAELRKKMKDVDELFLATDPDREGESISWHLKEALNPKVPVRRVVFHEITKKAVAEAFAHPRAIDQELVNAQEARRVLDRLVGYELSPLLWSKIATGLSAGRVQSVALRLLVDRERARMAFKTSAYWDLVATLAKGSSAFDARIFTLRGKQVANGKSFFDDATGKLLDPANVVLLDEKTAKDLSARLQGAPWKVASVEEQQRTSRPYEPFITDTFVSTANARLNLSARDSMRIAQSLYENGFITYHRTDSPALSDEGIRGARAAATASFGAEYLHPDPRIYAAKGSANAQEAHEAIRPAGEEFVPPKDTGLSGRELEVDSMIWRRTLASQMADERFTSTTAFIEALDAVFKATGKQIDFPGWRKAYGYDEEDESRLPRLVQGDALECQRCEAEPHETKPPARYNEGSLIKALKENGVGRPSTYAATIETLLNKNYAFLQGKALVPTFTGFAVTQLLERNFPAIVDVGFTAKMEEELDDIASGKAEWQPYLGRFWSGPKGLEAQVAERKSEIDPREVATIVLPQLKGIDAILRMGRYGPYLEVQNEKGETVRANVPQDTAPADLDRATVERLVANAARGPEPLGTDPATGKPVFLLDGRFGPYVQLGEVEEGSKKPPRSSLPRGVAPGDVTLEDALFLLSLPRSLGEHPEGGNVVAGLGRFGPYVMHAKPDGVKDYRSLKDPNQLRTVTLEDALALLAMPKFGRGSRAAPTVLKDLGPHPEDQAPVQVLSGRYGPYVKHGETNANVPQDQKPEDLTMEAAVSLLKAREARAAEGGGRKRRPARRSRK
jgi:DNA topoisomerase-1